MSLYRAISTKAGRNKAQDLQPWEVLHQDLSTIVTDVRRVRNRLRRAIILPNLPIIKVEEHSRLDRVAQAAHSDSLVKTCSRCTLMLSWTHRRSEWQTIQGLASTIYTTSGALHETRRFIRQRHSSALREAQSRVGMITLRSKIKRYQNSLVLVNTIGLLRPSQHQRHCTREEPLCNAVRSKRIQA